MVGSRMLNELVSGLVFICLFLVGTAVGIIWLFSWFYTPDELESKTIVRPRVEILIKDGKSDTTYFYKF